MHSRTIDAFLQAGPILTPYRRSGTGAPVLLLCRGALADRLLGRLAGRRCVIAPELPEGVPFTAWLCDVIDGLGLDRPAIVADATFAEAVRAFVRDEPDRVGRVVVVPG